MDAIISVIFLIIFFVIAFVLYKLIFNRKAGVSAKTAANQTVTQSKNQTEASAGNAKTDEADYEKDFFARTENGEESQLLLSLASLQDCMLIRSLLYAEGVPTYVEGEHMNNIYGGIIGTMTTVVATKIYILCADYDKAVDLIKNSHLQSISGITIFPRIKKSSLKLVSEIEGTHEAEVIQTMDDAYAEIQEKQGEWYRKSRFVCPEGCGECCRNFEPDVLDSEALYMAAWLIENQPEVAEKVSKGEFPFPDNNGCLFWDENNPYHCTIYGGRASICRLFGACGNADKEGKTVLKPCKFYPADKLADLKPPLEHRQYSQEELLKMYKVLPPVMGELMEKIELINPDSKETKLIRNALPEMINRLNWIRSMNQSK